MLAHGIDIIEISRIAKAADKWGTRFLKRVYTDREIEYCNGRFPQLAARFAAKEAVMKMLGTGLSGMSHQNIEVLPGKSGEPLVRLSGGAQARAQELLLSGIVISLSHCRDYAIASAIGETP